MSRFKEFNLQEINAILSAIDSRIAAMPQCMGTDGADITARVLTDLSYISDEAHAERFSRINRSKVQEDRK